MQGIGRGFDIFEKNSCQMPHLSANILSQIYQKSPKDVHRDQNVPWYGPSQTQKILLKPQNTTQSYFIVANNTSKCFPWLISYETLTNSNEAKMLDMKRQKLSQQCSVTLKFKTQHPMITCSRVKN